MARANVTVIINDESFFIPGTESGGTSRAGMPSYYNLIGAVGTTADRKAGVMTVENISDWISNLKSFDPIGWPGGHGVVGVVDGGGPAFIHGPTYSDEGNVNLLAGNSYAGGTYSRWPKGPTGNWKNEWWAVHNYLQYGGVCIVAGTASDGGYPDHAARLQDKTIPLDVVFGATGNYNSTLSSICTTRGDCIAVSAAVGDATLGDASSVTENVTNDEFNVSVWGKKKHLDIFRTLNEELGTGWITTDCAADVAGCLVRTDRLADPWWSPAGFKRGQILDVVEMQNNPSDSEMDTMYDAGVNPVVTFPGEGTMLFGDKTLAASSSTLSRINVSRLFIFLKKTIGAAARAKLFEFNDPQTRTSFVNAVVPVLNRIQARRGIYDFKVICDDSNNPGSIVDANQFVADVFIKPAKSINFIRLTFTNKNTQDTLE